ncbi:GroES-like protein [Massarina eburnea CBS 473.64]|uniref:GroES-like protein n=1 Tax=Massarina eburnea CBS 473.64 TaxID=1395130 RepID=A0A6A6S3S7_9PLEO|nr:GroES-like protein [Massarina eburnea CBS 473.64]
MKRLVQKALVVQDQGHLRLATDTPIPEPGEDQVLIKVEAVALNPSDVKHLDYSPAEGTVCGSDLAGIVTKVGGQAATRIAIGDRVSTVVFGCNPSRPSDGAFAEHIVARPEFCIKLPQDVGYEQGSSISVGLVTCGLVFKALGLLDNRGNNAIATKKHVLVYGGSTATGNLAIQLLSHLGHKPITACSPHNFDLVKKSGAVEAFDYRSPNCRADIQRYTDRDLGHVMDCITDSASMAISYGAIGPEGGHYVSLAPFPRGLKLRRKNVQPDWVLGYTIFGNPVILPGGYVKEESPEDVVFTRNWMVKMERLLAEGSIKPHPIQSQTGGLSGVIRDLDLLRRGVVSGKKLVYAL